MSGRVETIGDCTLYLGDCRDILPSLGRVYAVVTDPPYGLGDKLQGGRAEWRLHSAGEATAAWDADTVAEVPEIVRIARTAIVWGGHLYALPPSRGWLIWDKIVRQFSSGHCEMAWTTLDQPIRAFSFSHAELQHEGKVHPTQKPLALMAWCLSFIPAAGLICDPFMGSGTTGVACARAGRAFIGIERDPGYFDIACKRIAAAHAQPRLFDEPPPKPTQERLFR